MTTTKKLIVAVVALSLALVAFASVTVAWLTADSSEVVNTFTVGNIEIDLNETDVDGDGTKKNSYKVVPGGEIDKDPYVTVKANSEDCYVYVMVTNNLVIDKVTVATYTPNAKWELVGSKTDDNGVVTNLYRYKDIVKLSADAQDLEPVFSSVVYAGTEIDLDNIGDLDGKTIVVKAYAHQSANVVLDDVDASAKAWAGINAN